MSGWAVMDDVPEAIEDPSQAFVLGVQWHPEADELSRVIAALVEEARSRRDGRTPEPRLRPPHPLAERHLRLPAEDLAGARRLVCVPARTYRSPNVVAVGWRPDERRAAPRRGRRRRGHRHGHRGAFGLPSMRA